jgi:hypothetical protein
MAGIWTTEGSFQASTKMVEKKFLDERDRIPLQYETILNTYTPEKRARFVTFLPMAGLGFFQSKDEGEAPKFDTPNEMIPFTAFFQTFALAAAITKEATLEDPVDMWGKIPRMMANSERKTKDLLAAAMINLGFRTDNPISDGQPLFSTVHPLNPIVTPTGIVARGGQYQSNSMGASQLTAETLRQGELLFALMLDDRGKKDKRTPEWLVVHPDYSQIAEEIIGTPTAAYENTKKKNVQYAKWKVFAWRDLSNPYAWTQLAGKGEPGDDCHGLTVWFRWATNFWSFIDPMTQNRVIADSFRMAQGAWTYKGAVGSSGAGPVSF